jgi:hypothetical protein
LQLTAFRRLGGRPESGRILTKPLGIKKFSQKPPTQPPAKKKLKKTLDFQKHGDAVGAI